MVCAISALVFLLDSLKRSGVGPPRWRLRPGFLKALFSFKTLSLYHCLPGGGEEGDGGHAQAERQGGVQGAGGLKCLTICQLFNGSSDRNIVQL